MNLIETKSVLIVNLVVENGLQRMFVWISNLYKNYQRWEESWCIFYRL